jgi:hypothetical protein
MTASRNREPAGATCVRLAARQTRDRSDRERQTGGEKRRIGEAYDADVDRKERARLRLPGKRRSVEARPRRGDE